MNAKPNGPGVGDKAPDFCLPDKDEKNVCLSDFRKKWVVLYFYPKDNTFGCTIEANRFSRIIEDIKGENALVVGVSADSTESHRDFAQKHDLKVTLLSDTKHDMLTKYGVWNPLKIRDKEIMGVHRTTFLVDPDGKIAHVWPRVNVFSHADEVKKKLDELNRRDKHHIG